VCRKYITKSDGKSSIPRRFHFFAEERVAPNSSTIGVLRAQGGSGVCRIRLVDRTMRKHHDRGCDNFPLSKEFSMSSADAPQPPAPSPQELKAAMKAFRKRLKLTCLDDQSRIGVGPLSGGRRSGIVGITPPDQFPREVWEELARQGKLKKAGNGGQYELV